MQLKISYLLQTILILCWQKSGHLHLRQREDWAEPGRNMGFNDELEFILDKLYGVE